MQHDECSKKNCLSIDKLKSNSFQHSSVSNSEKYEIFHSSDTSPQLRRRRRTCSYLTAHLLICVLIVVLMLNSINRVCAILNPPVVNINIGGANAPSVGATRLLDKLSPFHNIVPDAYSDPVSLTTTARK